jgi:hypothetical protein
VSFYNNGCAIFGREFEMIRVVSISRDGIYGKSENALFRHLGKEFTDLKINPEFF